MNSMSQALKAAGIKTDPKPCPYCGGKVRLIGGNVIYPHRKDLYDLKFYQCPPCDAYVGCHKGTTKPLGRLANAELRAMKSMAHSDFDPIWKSGKLSRSDAYTWLANKLKISASDCHIGEFDVDTCERVIDICSNPNEWPSHEKQVQS